MEGRGRVSGFPFVFRASFSTRPVVMEPGALATASVRIRVVRMAIVSLLLCAYTKVRSGCRFVRRILLQSAKCEGTGLIAMVNAF